MPMSAADGTPSAAHASPLPTAQATSTKARQGKTRKRKLEHTPANEQAEMPSSSQHLHQSSSARQMTPLGMPDGAHQQRIHEQSMPAGQEFKEELPEPSSPAGPTARQPHSLPDAHSEGVRKILNREPSEAVERPQKKRKHKHKHQQHDASRLGMISKTQPPASSDHVQEAPPGIKADPLSHAHELPPSLQADLDHDLQPGMRPGKPMEKVKKKKMEKKEQSKEKKHRKHMKKDTPDADATVTADLRPAHTDNDRDIPDFDCQPQLASPLYQQQQQQHQQEGESNAHPGAGPNQQLAGIAPSQVTEIASTAPDAPMSPAGLASPVPLEKAKLAPSKRNKIESQQQHANGDAHMEADPSQPPGEAASRRLIDTGREDPSQPRSPSKPASAARPPRRTRSRGHVARESDDARAGDSGQLRNEAEVSTPLSQQPSKGGPSARGKGKGRIKMGPAATKVSVQNVSRSRRMRRAAASLPMDTRIRRPAGSPVSMPVIPSGGGRSRWCMLWSIMK